MCFDTESQRDIWSTQQGHQLLNASDSSLALFRSRAKLIAQRCEDRIGGEWGIGRFVSTANVVTDMLEINKKLGQEKLQYWGFVSILLIVISFCMNLMSVRRRVTALY